MRTHHQYRFAALLVLWVSLGCGSSDEPEPLGLAAAELETVVGAAELDLTEVISDGRAPFSFELTTGDADGAQ